MIAEGNPGSSPDLGPSSYPIHPGSKITPNSAFHLSKIQKNGIMVDLNKEIGVY